MGLIPRDAVFFDLFEKQGRNFEKAAEILCGIKCAPVDFQKVSKNFQELEHDCDEITHSIIERLNKTFLTPFDREDIHALAHELDDVVDFIEEAVFKMRLYHSQVFNEHMSRFLKIITDSLKDVAQALNFLRNRKDMKKVFSICVHINTLENEGDRAHREAMEELILNKDSMDSTSLLGLKEIYEALENTIDRCEDIANILEGIILKNI
jgi:hypothetical protein